MKKLKLMGFMLPTQEPAVAYSQFYDDLTPYGSWTNHGSYGYVWVPRVEVDFISLHLNNNHRMYQKRLF